MFYAQSKATGQHYALKIMEKSLISAEKAEEQCITEILLMDRLKHPNVLPLLTYFEDEKFIYLVLELADRQSLYTVIQHHKGIDEDAAAKILYQVISGIHYLHKQSPPVVHRDIKPENIVLVCGVCKLADFGSANTKDKIKKDTMCRTPEYLAPEMIMKKGHDEKVDVWAFGILAYEIVTGVSPFSEYISDQRGSATDLFNKLTTAIIVDSNYQKQKIRIVKPSSLDFVDLVYRCLEKESRKRISSGECLRHPFFASRGLLKLT